MQGFRFTRARRRRRVALAGIAAAVLAGAGAGLVAPAPALAQRQPYTPSMACADVIALVNKVGAIVLYTGPNTYDRYVRDRSFCGSFAEQVKPEWVLSRDKRQCFPLYVCFFPSRDDGRR